MSVATTANCRDNQNPADRTTIQRGVTGSVWKTFDVKFRAPRFDTSGTKTENARFLEVRHNGVLIHEDVEMKGPNSAHMDIPEAPRGSLMLQGDHGPVAYRNVRIRPLSSP